MTTPAQSNIVFLRQWSTKHLSCHVREFIVAASPTTVNPDGPLHWRISLAIDGDRLVVLDLTPSGGEDLRTGVLIIDTKSNEDSSSAIAIHKVEPARTVTVQEILQVLQDLGRDRYRFDESFSGCRFWCCTIIGDLETHGIVPSGAREALEQYISNCHDAEPARYPMPTRMGAFF